MQLQRTFAFVAAAAAAVALFVGLVYGVLLAAHVAEPAAATVQGMTPMRLWATTSAVLALAGVVSGGMALVRPAGRLGAAASGRPAMVVALAAGLVAAISGGLNLAVAGGGPGTGNGVVGGAVAVVLGLVAMALGGLALARSRGSGLRATRTSEPMSMR